MLPRFRFILAATFLSLSLVIFGLGAAGLLRSTHDKYVSLSIRRAELAYYPPQQTFPNPVVASLRLDDMLLSPNGAFVTSAPLQGSGEPAVDDETISETPGAEPQALAPDSIDLATAATSVSTVEADGLRKTDLTIAALALNLPQPANLTPSISPDAATTTGSTGMSNAVVTVEAPAPMPDVAEVIAEPVAQQPEPVEEAPAVAPVAAPSNIEIPPSVVEASEPEIKLADVRMPAERPTSAPPREALAVAERAPEPVELGTAATSNAATSATAEVHVLPEHAALAEQEDIALSADEVRLPVSRPKPELAAKNKAKPSNRVAARQDSAPPRPAPATYRAETISFDKLFR